MENLRTRSGSVTISGRLVAFLYDLMRDHVTPGAVEELMLSSASVDVEYTNGWLASYAKDVAYRLIRNLKAMPAEPKSGDIWIDENGIKMVRDHHNLRWLPLAEVLRIVQPYYGK